LVCQKQPKAVQPAQPTSQSCQKTNFKKTYGTPLETVLNVK